MAIMKFTFYLYFLFLFASCVEQKKNAQDALLDNVMENHDEIMEKMGEIMNYKRQLTKKMSALVAEREEVNIDKISELKNAIESLENSHDEMMNWMHGFSGDFKEMTKNEILEYLNNQKRKIEQVGIATNKALKNAEELLAM